MPFGVMEKLEGRLLLSSVVNSASLSAFASAPAIPTLSISANKPKASEANPTTTGEGQFTISRHGSTNTSITVVYAVSGTAVNGIDYSSLSGEATIPAGKSSVSINLIPTSVVLTEGKQTVGIMLQSSIGNSYAINASKAQATVTITDHQIAPHAISGQSITAHISSGNGAFASSGSFQIILSSSNTAYVLIGAGNVASSHGTYTYTQTTPTGSRIRFNDSAIGVGTMTVVYTSSTAASYQFIDGDGDSQTGTLKFAAAPTHQFAPFSLAGHSVVNVISSGTSPYASSGSYRLVLSNSTYELEGIKGIPDSAGNYTAQQLTPTTVFLTADDELLGDQLGLLTFTSSSKANFVFIDLGTGAAEHGVSTFS
jgi:hypothetical protein